jgi:hypothetical protein
MDLTKNAGSTVNNGGFNGFHGSLDWLKGTSIGNHRFSDEI